MDKNNDNNSSGNNSHNSPNRDPRKPDFNFSGGGGDFKPNRNLVIIAVVVIVGILIFFLLARDNTTNDVEIPYSSLTSLIKSNPGSIQQLSIYQSHVEGVCAGSCNIGGQYGDIQEFIVKVDASAKNNLVDTLDQYGANISYDFITEEQSVFGEILINLIPWILIFGVLWFVMFRQIQSSGSKALSFGKSKAKLQKDSDKKITFKDVAGVQEAKEELVEIIEFLKDPQKFRRLGAKIPKGVLLTGPPGTGKTLLARASSGEANRPFFSMSGSDFVEMFVGVGASRVRDLFDQGKKNAPCIIFIDELDAVGRVRGAGYGGGHDEREQTLNQMLVEMDGFETDETVIVMAATNRPDVLDPALLRPGRFDRQIVVNLPDVKGREGILKVHMEKIPIARDVDPMSIARGTPGFSGADLASLVNEAALIAGRRGKKKVQMDDFEYAKDKVLMGPERKSMVLSEKEKTLTAFHEAGHALLGHFLKNADPLHKVTIIPRGRALGLTQFLPKEDRHSYAKAFLIDQITMALGGRIAEEVKFGKDFITNGASNDIENATRIARAMVTEWGMSDSLGPLSYGQKEEPIFIGKEIARHKDYSEETAEKIDIEIKTIIDGCLENAKKIINDNWELVEKLATKLLKYEVLDANQIEAVLEGKPFPEPEPSNYSYDNNSETESDQDDNNNYQEDSTSSDSYNRSNDEVNVKDNSSDNGGNHMN